MLRDSLRNVLGGNWTKNFKALLNKDVAKLLLKNDCISFKVGCLDRWNKLDASTGESFQSSASYFIICLLETNFLKQVHLLANSCGHQHVKSSKTFALNA